MTRELELQLAARWPTWFRLDGDPRETGMVDGFRCGDGWFQLIWRLCEDLEPLVAKLESVTGTRFEILQVKSKFGVLRVNPNHQSDEIRARIQAATLESAEVCDRCGGATSTHECHGIEHTHKP